MTELERFRDHCREMAAHPHVVDCYAETTDRWGWTKRVRPDPACPGCLTDADQALWTSLADEVDAYLTNDDAPLWEDA